MLEKIKIISLLVSRGLLGGVYIFFGLNWFLNFFELPPHQAAAEVFLSGLASSKYFFPMLKFMEIFFGVFLITGFFTPLVLVMLMPITLNIFVYNIFLNPDNMPLAASMTLLHIYLLFLFRKSYKGLFEM